MTTPQLWAVLTRRGLSLAAEGEGVRVTPASKLTQEDREAIQNQKPEVVALLAGTLRIECRWNNGYVGRHWFPEKGWPTGAWWWRYQGEAEWKPVPGTPGETQKEPRWGETLPSPDVQT